MKMHVLPVKVNAFKSYGGEESVTLYITWDSRRHLYAAVIILLCVGHRIGPYFSSGCFNGMEAIALVS